jgi:hypothetical protein
LRVIEIRDGKQYAISRCHMKYNPFELSLLRPGWIDLKKIT